MLQTWSPDAAIQASAFHERFAQLHWDDSAAIESFTMDLFRWQAQNVPVYAAYLGALRIKPENIQRPVEIPGLPLSCFKTHQVQSWDFAAATTFTSSSTTGQIPSKHALPSLAFYENHSLSLFESVYGAVTDWVILALLPSYLERGGSSLVYMVDFLIRKGGQAESGFFMHDFDALAKSYAKAKAAGKKVLVLGVSYALLDLSFSSTPLLLQSDDALMETGGMKGRRREMIREELHNIFREQFGVDQVHSEYGMTELLSQAYATSTGLYVPPRCMIVYVRDVNDPFSVLPSGKAGGINLIDLANIDSCSFLQTQDLGRMHANGQFEIIGRFDHSDVRGCNLMAG